MTDLLLICFLFLTSPIGGSFGIFQCPEESGTFPDPEDCSKFYVCSNGVVHQQSCPSGLRFSSSGLFCDWPDNVVCGSAPSTTSSSTSSTFTSTSTTAPTSSTSTYTTASTTTNKPTSTSTEPPVTKTTSVESESTTTTFSSTSTSPTYQCSFNADEPISEVVKQRRKTSCMLPSDVAENVFPGNTNNPENVKILEAILSKTDFKNFFPNANPAYTYENFLKAISIFPAMCQTADLCRKILPNMFAHFQQETAGLFYLEEINKAEYCAQWTSWVTNSFPCSSGIIF